MPKRSKESRADAAKSSAARSKKPYSVYLDDDLRAELRSWPKRDRKRIGGIIRRVQEGFGKPHMHSSIGVRDLSPSGSRLNVYECRIGLALRLIFTLEKPSLLYFHMVGTHDEVQRFLGSFRLRTEFVIKVSMAPAEMETEA